MSKSRSCHGTAREVAEVAASWEVFVGEGPLKVSGPSPAPGRLFKDFSACVLVDLHL